MSFRYNTMTAAELTCTYVNYLFTNFPLGSLEMRPIDLSQVCLAIARLLQLSMTCAQMPQKQLNVRHEQLAWT